MVQLGMFAKYWQPNAVKTRLAATIGPGAAATLYRQFILCQLDRFRTFGDQRVVSFTPLERRDEFRKLASTDWQLVEQGEGHLGARIRRYFERFAAEAAAPGNVALLIGSDSPTLPYGRLEAAAGALGRNQVVIGPSEDGGYYLIGLRADAIEIPLLDLLFDNLPWSEPTLFNQTAMRLAHHHIPFELLADWYDIDDATDLLRLRRELKNAGDAPLRRLRSVVESCYDR